ncbi:ZYRO0E01628p [Zygosaccharomyces rouxii]|uniref:ZYRO0E01628p n=1 Tax=Zygosaccharomyces rouxii (strain ATCC 2623 / CBS 732 / NBRC 1130 / NCYC 568 / NRRL Y-229) TaxID=559307 RepID=C5E401_ZYGRC|nr:uncharacterized protein ZYRO0E01628g [Zygosaccharomyces rouxii]KAH9198377.1 hypothetical protein LQ764DRAFT_236260 [Zygosaccharomyces rouxii]CAR30762.1 ZYRO0E01628p [Zygosaccharomyces rouxii]
MTGLSESFLQLTMLGDGSPNEDVLQLLMYSNFREQLSESAQELHNITDRILVHRASRSVTSIEAHGLILPLMAMLIESRERAKRIYRDALSSRMSTTTDWNIDPLCDEVHEELIRTNDLLKLYPRRESLW